MLIHPRGPLKDPVESVRVADLQAVVRPRRFTVSLGKGHRHDRHIAEEWPHIGHLLPLRVIELAVRLDFTDQAKKFVKRVLAYAPIDRIEEPVVDRKRKTCRLLLRPFGAEAHEVNVPMVATDEDGELW